MPEGRRRLDLELESRGLARSRSQARDLIRRGLVAVDGASAAKPGILVTAASDIVTRSEAASVVSRAGAKLGHGLDHFGLDPAGRAVVDLGASTGGFTQVLIDRGAARVYAVDVGHGQLASTLRADPRVVSLEGVDARSLDARIVPEPAGAITVDLSFISLTQALGPALALATSGAWLVALVKPQFEAGREHVGKGGIIRDANVRRAAVDKVGTFLLESGWRVVGATKSPVPGKAGNEEWLIAAERLRQPACARGRPASSCLP